MKNKRSSLSVITGPVSTESSAGEETRQLLKEQKKLLKDRQTRESLAIFSELMVTLDEKDQMKSYLSKQLKETEKELAVYKRKADKIKAEKIALMEEEKQKKRLGEEIGRDTKTDCKKEICREDKLESKTKRLGK